MRVLHRHLILPLLALFLAASALSAEEPNRNVRFGLPSPAKADPKQREDYLIERPQYVLSYNAKTRTPNWVSWELRKEDIGKAARRARRQASQHRGATGQPDPVSGPQEGKDRSAPALRVRDVGLRGPP